MFGRLVNWYLPDTATLLRARSPADETLVWWRVPSPGMLVVGFAALFAAVPILAATGSVFQSALVTMGVSDELRRAEGTPDEAVFANVRDVASASWQRPVAALGFSAVQARARRADAPQHWRSLCL